MQYDAHMHNIFFLNEPHAYTYARILSYECIGRSETTKLDKEIITNALLLMSILPATQKK